MISLEQVRQLDIRVKKAVTAVKTLSVENSALKQQIAELEARLDELRREASDRKADEQQLEVSLQGVLDVLDEVNGETSEIEPEPPADNYVIETVPEPEEDEIIDPESDEDEGSEQDLVFAPDSHESDSQEPEAPGAEDSTVIEMPAVELPADEDPVNEEMDTESDITEVAADISEAEEVVVEISAAESEDTDPEVVSLESDNDEEKEIDENNKFQSEFDIF